MANKMYIFQMSGIRCASKKRELLLGIRQMGAIYLGGSTYQQEVTHLIVEKPSASEKFLASCAAGKYIVTPEYVYESVHQRVWLSECLFELHLTAQNPETPVPFKTWREKLTSCGASGAFQGWCVLIDTDESKARHMFIRILKAGHAVVFTDWPDSQQLTLVLTKDESKDGVKIRDIPHYHVSHIAKHLLVHEYDVNQSDTNDLSEDEENIPSESASVTMESMDMFGGFSEKHLEKMLVEYIASEERIKKAVMTFPEYYDYYNTSQPDQTLEVNFCNVQSLVDCEFFFEASEEILGFLFPGVLPPVPLLHQFMQHALHGKVAPLFPSTFLNVLHSILRNCPTWDSDKHTRYFHQVLQCPECKDGLWSFLEMSYRACLETGPTCHSMPKPLSPEMFQFHCDLQEFFLRIFQLELHASLGRQSPGKLQTSVLYSTFWNVWDKSTLSSGPLKQLTNLLIQAVQWSRNVKGWRLKTLVTLQETLQVVVEFWAHQQSFVNRCAVDNSFLDMAEHITMLCQDFNYDTLKSVISSLCSTRLRLLTADVIFRNLCCTKSLTISSEPLSLLKIVSTYLKAIEYLCKCPPPRQTDPSTVAPDCLKDAGGEMISGGDHRVNTAGETVLHQACKKNKVETLLSLIRLPATDVNVKDHAGWTPLHEACNHGSTECVQALLQHCPELQLAGQVDGVSPLHDALMNQHTQIAKMLLCKGGSALLRLVDGEGRSPLHLVPSASLRQELQECADQGDQASIAACLKIQDPSLVEFASFLLVSILLTYVQEKNVPSCKNSVTSLNLNPNMIRALSRLDLAMLASWQNASAVTLAKDLITMLDMKKHVSMLSPLVRACEGGQASLLQLLLESL